MTRNEMYDALAVADTVDADLVLVAVGLGAQSAVNIGNGLISIKMNDGSGFVYEVPTDAWEALMAATWEGQEVKP